MSVALLDSASVSAAAPAIETGLEAWENSADPVYCRDLRGRILAVNHSFARKFGRSHADLVGQSVAELVWPEDVPALESVVAELSRPPHRAVGEHRWRTPQGIRWFAWEKTALFDAAGQVVAVRAVGRDITRQRLAEEQFYRLSRAVEQSPVATVITDLEGHAQYVNSKFTEVSGRTLEDILDRKIEVLRDGHASEASYQEFWRTVRAGGEWRGELTTERPGGGTVAESIKVSCLRSPTGEITNFLCLREDVTERKKLEHELRQAYKMESLGTLASGIAHDFNNLLAIINGYAEFCLQGTAEAAILQKSLREIHRAAQRAGGLVRQILTFSRKTEVKFSPLDLNRLIRELVAMLAETFPRNVSFTLDLDDQLPPLLADANQIQQIILNLCVNARDAMPGGGLINLSTQVQPATGVRHHTADPGSCYACLKVGDTGTGMTEAVRQRIFEPFFTTKQGSQGTGLGLAVVYGVVVSHHGHIEVESTPGAGSAFTVHLPLAAGPNPAPTTFKAGDFPGGSESLLIVDDEESLRSLLATALIRKGYQAATAASGLEAISLLSDTSRTFDLALLDLNMPGATGVEVLKVIRVCRPQLKVLVISGHITPETHAELVQLGQRDFVQKPYRLDEVGRHIRRLLETVPGGPGHPPATR
jgi:two-component system cell cycle sensor histidine kinase/response regulator CckA